MFLKKSLGLVSPWSPVCPRYVLCAYFSGLRVNDFFFFKKLVFKIKEKGLLDSIFLELSAERPKHCLESLFPDSLTLCFPSQSYRMGSFGLHLCRRVDSTGARLTLCLQLQLPASLSKKKSCQQGVGGLPAAVLLIQAACSQPSRR